MFSFLVLPTRPVAKQPSGCVSFNVTPKQATHAATHCNAPQLTATNCNSLQLTATHCSSALVGVSQVGVVESQLFLPQQCCGLPHLGGACPPPPPLPSQQQSLFKYGLSLCPPHSLRSPKDKKRPIISTNLHLVYVYHSHESCHTNESSM
jgi:hypothetical protein